MHAVLGFEVAVRVVAAHHRRGALDARFVAGLVLHHFSGPAAALAESQVHAQQHLRPVLRLRATGAGVNGQDGVAIVVLAGKLHRHLDGVDLRLELLDELLDVATDVLPFALQLQQHIELLRFSLDRRAGLEAFFHARALAPQLLRRLGLVPEAGRGHVALDLAERLSRRGYVKGNSGPRRGGL